MENLYFLWSVERVAVLYDLKTIGGKDWYGWGAQILLANQRGAGNWTGGGPVFGALLSRAEFDRAVQAEAA